MSDLEKILLTASSTVLGGVIVFVVGQIVTRFLIEPLHEQRKVVGSVADALIYYAHYFADSGTPQVAELSDIRDAADRFRRLACELTAKTVSIPGYRLLGWMHVLRPYGQILKARGALFGLSNTLIRPDWERKLRLASEVARALSITAIDRGLLAQDWSQSGQ